MVTGGWVRDDGMGEWAGGAISGAIGDDGGVIWAARMTANGAGAAGDDGRVVNDGWVGVRGPGDG